MSDYQNLFERYLAEIRGASAAAKAWWTQLEHHERARFRTVKEAKASLEQRWPFGPMSHPWVLGVYRKYFFLTLELNHRHAQGDKVPPVVPTEADWGRREDSKAPKGKRLRSREAFADMDDVAPWILLVDSLYGVDKKLAEALAWIVHQPIGFDADDKPL